MNHNYNAYMYCSILILVVLYLGFLKVMDKLVQLWLNVVSLET